MTCIFTQNVTLPQVFFKHFASKSQLPGFHISGTLTENGLIYADDISHLKCVICIYADDSCLAFPHKDIHEIEKPLNEDFSNTCDWFVVNKLSIQFGEDKTKSITFASKFKRKMLRNLS